MSLRPTSGRNSIPSQALTAGEKDSIINDILVIDGRGTLATYMVVGDNSIDGRVSRDGGPPERDTTFPVTWVDADQFRWTNARGEQTWGITWDGDSYHLVARTPAGGDIQTVRPTHLVQISAVLACPLVASGTGSHATLRGGSPTSMGWGRPRTSRFRRSRPFVS